MAGNFHHSAPVEQPFSATASWRTLQRAVVSFSSPSLHGFHRRSSAFIGGQYVFFVRPNAHHQKQTWAADERR